MKKEEVYGLVDELEPLCKTSCRKIWENPELGTNEKESSAYFKDILKEEGFQIKVIDQLPYAFCAEYGTGKPVIAILGEYDALPGLSQKVSAVKEEIVENGPGHGCGHNLLGSASATAAIAIKRFLEKEKIEGTVRFYGCPEEELLCGKVKMVYYKMFDGCDLALSWHPMSSNMVYDKAYLASASAKFHFKGISSHAGFAPENGRSALDAVELMNVGVQYLREHVIDRTRIHYTTDSCGYAPNIVHPRANSWYYVRAPFMSNVKETLERIKKVALGAAMMTETEVEMVIDSGCCEMLTNQTFADLAWKNLDEADLPVYTEEEMKFAKELQDTLDPEMLKKEKKAYSTDAVMLEEVSPRDQWKISSLNASTDSGDVSYIMPMNLFTTACWPLGVAAHTWQATAAAGTSIGEKGALYAAKVMAGTAFDLYTDEKIREQIIEEFHQNHPGEYAPLYEES